LKIGIPQRAITWDIADEVSFAVMKKLCDGKSLKTIAGYQYAKAGLGQAVENIVRSWNRERNLQKHAHEAHVQKNLTTLDAPLGEEVDDECLIEVIADPQTNPIPGIEVEATRENITQLMREVESIKDDRKRLAFKINVIFYNPLSDEDIKEIAALRGIAPSEIETEVDAIVARLADQNEQIERQQDLMANKFADLQRQVMRLKKMEKDFNTPESELKELERDIARKTKELENLNKRNQMVNVYPTAEEVANLLKIPKEKQKNIAVWLNRIRKKLENIKLRNKQQVFAS
jgi:DNA repair exonuclease SbcCD ATPase subunit